MRGSSDEGCPGYFDRFARDGSAAIRPSVSLLQHIDAFRQHGHRPSHAARDKAANARFEVRRGRHHGYVERLYDQVELATGRRYADCAPRASGTRRAVSVVGIWSEVPLSCSVVTSGQKRGSVRSLVRFERRQVVGLGTWAVSCDMSQQVAQPSTRKRARGVPHWFGRCYPRHSVVPDQ